MDDIVITEVDSIGITRLKRFLQLHFHNKDPRKLQYFLGIEVTQSKQGINLYLRKYVLDIIEDTGLLGSCLVETPMDPNQKLLRDKGDPFFRC